MFRLLIADDEDLVRRGLVALIEREAPEITIVGTAVDGEDALNRAWRDLPDVVLTDIRMPGVNGLDLIQRLRAGHPNMRCIILSGYDEFGYARRAVSLGVAEYLLKPVDPDELLLLLKRMQAEVEAERQELALRKVTFGITLEQCVRRLLDGAQVHEEVLASCFGAAPAWGLLLVQSLTDATDKHGALRDACAALLKQAVVVEDTYGYLCVLFPLQDDDTAQAVAAARALHQGLREGGMAAAITVARPSASLIGIGDTHGEAIETAEYHQSGSSAEPLLSWELSSHPAERWPALPPARRDALLDAVVQGLETEAQREAHAFMLYAREHVPPGAQRALWFQIMVLLVNRVQQFGVRADVLLQPRHDLRALLAGGVDAGSQEEQLVAVATRAARECRRLRTHCSPRATIQELREYIMSHLAGDLTIGALARRVHLNAKYLGEVFKQNTGESLGEYVIRARMKRASELLSSTSLKVYVIAEHVGYSDPKHFATMFRSVIGTSPVEYRERIRQQDDALAGHV